MKVYRLSNLERFGGFYATIGSALLKADSVPATHWQSQDVSDRPEMVTREIPHTILEIPLDDSPEMLVRCIEPNLPWAEDHFQERVSGKPLNPPPSEAWWPYAQSGNAAHKDGQQFSHTYPERLWPKHARHDATGNCQQFEYDILCPYGQQEGIRYRLGDLNDVVDLLNRDPLTRQAFVPIWFPEDTGAVQGQRVPCTLGYHFLMRNGAMDITYYIRSCDFIRHFRDDIYMAARLLQWIIERMKFDCQAGNFIMDIGSLHIFEGDVYNLQRTVQNLLEQDRHRLTNILSGGNW